jgi:hypothetical protein
MFQNDISENYPRRFEPSNAAAELHCLNQDSESRRMFMDSCEDPVANNSIAESDMTSVRTMRDGALCLLATAVNAVQVQRDERECQRRPQSDVNGM